MLWFGFWHDASPIVRLRLPICDSYASRAPSFHDPFEFRRFVDPVGDSFSPVPVPGLSRLFENRPAAIDNSLVVASLPRPSPDDRPSDGIDPCLSPGHWFYSSGPVRVPRAEASCFAVCATVIYAGAPLGLPCDLDLVGISLPFRNTIRSPPDRTIADLFLLTVSGFPTALESSRRIRGDSPQCALGWKAFDNGCLSRLFSQLAASFQGSRSEWSIVAVASRRSSTELGWTLFCFQSATRR